MSKMTLDLSSVESTSNFDPLPPGWFPFEVLSAEVGRSKSSNNPMITVELSCLHPDHEGRRVWDYFVLSSDIGLSRLKALLQAGGHPNPDHPNDSDELLGLRVECKLAIQRDEQFGDKNKVKGVRAIKPASMPAATPHAAQAMNPQAPPAQMPTGPAGTNGGTYSQPPAAPPPPPQAPAATPPAQPAPATPQQTPFPWEA